MIEQKQAIKDMIDFIVKFELWLEGEEMRCNSQNADEAWDNGYAVAIEHTLSIYRQCKKKIQYHDE